MKEIQKYFQTQSERRQKVYMIIAMIVTLLFLVFIMYQASFGKGGYALFSFFFIGVLMIGAFLGFFTLIFTGGKGSQKFWGYLRAIGILGLIGSSIRIYGYWMGTHGPRFFAMKHPEVSMCASIFVISFFTIIMSEIVRYLDQLHSFHTISMTCTRCTGKGFVDQNDIKRLRMDDFWHQGPCNYCEGKGIVPRGKTTTDDVTLETGQP